MECDPSPAMLQSSSLRTCIPPTRAERFGTAITVFLNPAVAKTQLRAAWANGRELCKTPLHSWSRKICPNRRTPTVQMQPTGYWRESCLECSCVLLELHQQQSELSKLNTNFSASSQPKRCRMKASRNSTRTAARFPWKKSAYY